MIEKNLRDYFIFEIDKNPVGCVALHLYPEQNLGELACLYVSASHENEGIGRRLIQFVENRARELGLRSPAGALDPGVHLLSIQGPIHRRKPEDLPPERRETVRSEAGATRKLLMKTLR